MATQRQINDYKAGKSANMSPALISEIVAQINATQSPNAGLAGWAIPNQSGITTQSNAPAQQFLPTSQVISNLNNYATTFQDQPSMANQFKVLGNELSDADKLRNQVADFYGMFEQSTNPYWEQFMNLNQGVGNDVLGQFQSNKQVFDTQYGPQGEQRQRLDQYYGDLGDYLAGSSADDIARAEADSIASGASIGARRASRNAAEKTAFEKAMEAKKQEIADYDNLYKTVNAYLDNYLKTYAGSKDKYVLETYQKLLDFKNQLGTGLVNAQTSLITEGIRAGGLGGSASGGTGTGTAASTPAVGFTGGDGTVATPEQIAADTAARAANTPARNGGVTEIPTPQNNGILSRPPTAEEIQRGLANLTPDQISQLTPAQQAEARNITNALAGNTGTYTFSTPSTANSTMGDAVRQGRLLSPEAQAVINQNNERAARAQQLVMSTLAAPVTAAAVQRLAATLTPDDISLLTPQQQFNLDTVLKAVKRSNSTTGTTTGDIILNLYGSNVPAATMSAASTTRPQATVQTYRPVASATRTGRN